MVQPILQGPLPLTAVASLHRHWVWFLVLGLFLVAVGVFGLIASGLLTLASVLLIGWMLLLTGGVVAIDAFWVHRWSGFFVQLAFGILNVVVGGLLVTRPVAGALALTLLLGASLFVQGIFRLAVAITANIEGKAWLVISALASLLLGLMIWAEWPASGVWVIGLFAAIDLIFYGWWLVSAALAARRVPIAA